KSLGGHHRCRLDRYLQGWDGRALTCLRSQPLLFLSGRPVALTEISAGAAASDLAVCRRAPRWPFAIVVRAVAGLDLRRFRLPPLAAFGQVYQGVLIMNRRLFSAAGAA